MKIKIKSNIKAIPFVLLCIKQEEEIGNEIRVEIYHLLRNL